MGVWHRFRTSSPLGLVLLDGAVNKREPSIAKSKVGCRFFGYPHRRFRTWRSCWHVPAVRNLCYFSDMSGLVEQIVEQISDVPEGRYLTAKELLHLGNRAAVGQALSRLARRGQLIRVGRGLYVQPIQVLFGYRPPAASKTVEALGAQRGVKVVRHGAAAANALGLTTQMPVREVYLTSRRSRELKLGAQTVALRHAARGNWFCPVPSLEMLCGHWRGWERNARSLRASRSQSGSPKANVRLFCPCGDVFRRVSRSR